MDRARAIETLFRKGKGGLEPLAPPNEGGTHVHYQATRLCGVGCKTSRSPAASTDEEWLAFQHGITVAEVRKLIAEARDGN